MYEDWTQNNDTARIARNSRYITHPFPCHIIHSHAQTIAQLWTQLKTQRFSAVTVSLTSGFSKVFLKKNWKNLKLTFDEVFKVFFCKKLNNLCNPFLQPWLNKKEQEASLPRRAQRVRRA